MINLEVELIHLSSPDKGWIELSVDEHNHLESHGAPQPTDTGHHRLKPEHA